MPRLLGNEEYRLFLTGSTCDGKMTSVLPGLSNEESLSGLRALCVGDFLSVLPGSLCGKLFSLWSFPQSSSVKIFSRLSEDGSLMKHFSVFQGCSVTKYFSQFSQHFSVMKNFS